MRGCIATLVALLCGFALCGACEAPLSTALQVTADERGVCYFDATVPAAASFTDIASQFALNRQFCSWISFENRTLVGLGFAYPVDQRSGWEVLNGAPKENVATCNVQSMIDAGWTLRPRRFRSRDEYNLACARYGIPMSINAVAAEGDTILSLPQLCFATSWGDKESFDAALRFESVGSSLPMRWALPVRFFHVESDKGLLRLWFDDVSGAAWSDDWSGYVIAAAKEQGIQLIQKTCGTFKLPEPAPKSP